jgi:MFS transporter, FSR family, fosmidomycin resistance protein
MTAALRRLLPGAGVDRPAVAALTAGHVGADLFLGALPALIPFLVARYDIGYADAGLLVLAGSLASAILQPVAGLVGDRLHVAWLPPLGLVLAGAGLVAATALHDLAATAIALIAGGVGVAIFHPEAVRATRDAGGASPGAALGLFAVGGTFGFALGPALAVPLAAAFGLGAAGLVAGLPLLAALALVVWAPAGGRAGAVLPGARGGGARDVRAFLLASAAATALAAFIFGVMAFVPVWFADDLGSSVRLGSAVVAIMLVAGALGTYAGGRLSDARGRRFVVAGSLGLLVPLALVVPLAPLALAVPLLVVVGLAMDASYYRSWPRPRTPCPTVAAWPRASSWARAWASAPRAPPSSATSPTRTGRRPRCGAAPPSPPSPSRWPCRRCAAGGSATPCARPCPR